MSTLTEFYNGLGRDSEGRTLADLWAYSDGELESVHDFIQWLFPLRDPSRFNPDAPRLTDADIAAFRDNPEMRRNVRRSFDVLLAFLGLRYQEGRVVEAGDFDSKRRVFGRPNHNWLRITRVLLSLRLLGLDEESLAFFQFLKGLREAPRSAITDETFRFWRDAATGV